MTAATLPPEPTTDAPEPLVFDLVFRRQAWRKKTGANGWEEIPSRTDELPLTPPGFVPMTGTYREIAERASTLNEPQLRSGFLDYLYSPEVRSA